MESKRKSGGEKGFSLAELMMVVTIIMTLALIVIGNVWRARLRANEASAVASARAIQHAEEIYAATYDQGYSTSLEQLGRPANGKSTSAEAADILPEDLVSGIKGGYRFTYRSINQVPGTTSKMKASVYSLNIDPLSPGMTGIRHFYTDESGLLRYDVMEVADASSPLLGSGETYTTMPSYTPPTGSQTDQPVEGKPGSDKGDKNDKGDGKGNNGKK